MKQNTSTTGFTGISLIIACICLYFYLESQRKQCFTIISDSYVKINLPEKSAKVDVEPCKQARPMLPSEITDLRAIKREDIGRIYYFDCDGAITFYNMGGKYPRDSSKLLLPMTASIYEKYVLHK